MAKTIAQVIHVYGARVLIQHLSAMQAEVEGVRCGEDIESIHRMRVASRRMRSALKIFKDCFPKADYKNFTGMIRSVTQVLGHARDLDVQLEILKKNLSGYFDPKLKPGIKRLMLRLRQKRQLLQDEVVQAMNQLEQADTLGRMARWANSWLEKELNAKEDTAVLFQLAAMNIRSRLEELTAYDQLVRVETNVTELHEMRIHAKQLRYTMEAFEDLYGFPISPFINQAKKIQALLGSIHDTDVWMGMIPNFIEEEEQRIVNCFGNNRRLRRLLPGLNAFSADRKLSRDEEYQEFLTFWDETLSSGMWGELLILIDDHQAFPDNSACADCN